MNKESYQKMNESGRYSVIKIKITTGSVQLCRPTPQGVYVSSPLPVLFLCQFQILEEYSGSCANITPQLYTYHRIRKTECLPDINTHLKL